MKRINTLKKLTLSLAVAMTTAGQATEIKVTVENLTQSGGVFLTPLWVGFHDGSFDSYDTGAPASIGIERIAEDGDVSALSELFKTQAPTGLDGVILNPEGFAGAPVFEPGSTSTQVFDVNPTTQKYFSYADMIIPSNDAFIANANPKAHQLFDANGHFVGPMTFTVYGTQVRDAGTEANTETNAAFLNQSAPNTGQATADNITVHPGFNGSQGNPSGSPVNILGGTTASGDTVTRVNGDFTKPRYAIMRITISENVTPVRVAIKNAAPAGGTFLTPFWVGFHDGNFDIYDTGQPASAALESIAEDGNSALLQQDFATANAGLDAVITNPAGFAGAPLFDPGLSSQQVFNLNPAQNKYFSYASMILPSNDAFVANANPKRHQLFDDNGHFTGPVTFSIYGTQVRDAGTESNTETDAPFFDQQTPNTGETTSDPVTVHPGFNGSVGNPDASPQNFLGGTNGAGFTFDQTAADFSISGSKIAEIAVSRLVDGSFSGTWYNPNRSGEGFFLDITDSFDKTGEVRAAVSWYTYTADGSNTQQYIVGDGPVIGNTMLASMYTTSGTGFGENFNANAVERTPWGDVSIKFTSCDTAVVSYKALDSRFGSGSYELKRLTAGPAGYQGACQL